MRQILPSASRGIFAGTRSLRNVPAGQPCHVWIPVPCPVCCCCPRRRPSRVRQLDRGASVAQCNYSASEQFSINVTALCQGPQFQLKLFAGSFNYVRDWLAAFSSRFRSGQGWKAMLWSGPDLICMLFFSTLRIEMLDGQCVWSLAVGSTKENAEHLLVTGSALFSLELDLYHKTRLVHSTGFSGKTHVSCLRSFPVSFGVLTKNIPRVGAEEGGGVPIKRKIPGFLDAHIASTSWTFSVMMEILDRCCRARWEARD